MENRNQLILLALFRVTRSVAAGMITIAFPYLILRSLHYSALMLGLLYTAAALATAVFGLLFGFLADIWGREKTLWVVGLLIPLSAGLVYFSSHLAILFVASILGGFSATGSLMGGGVGGAAAPIQSAVIADLTTPENRTSYFSILTFLSGVFAAGGALLVRVFSIREAFLAAALISLAGVVLLFPIRARNVRGKLRKLESKGVIGKFTLTGALNGFTQGLITPFLIPFFVLVYHVPKGQMSVYGFVSGVVGSLALLAAPLLEQHWGFVRSIAVTRGLGTALLIALPLIHLLPLAVVIYCLTPALRIMALPVQQTALTQMVVPDEIGRALGINQVARLAASSGGIALTGELFNVDDFGLPFYLYAVVMSFNILLYFRFFGPLEARLRGEPPAAETSPAKAEGEVSELTLNREG